ncbi:MAG: hypothetical protein RLZZ524_1832 [Pseudomonadota bacterium]
MASELWMPEGFDWKNPNYDEVWQRRAKMLTAIRSGKVDIDAVKVFYSERPAQFIHDWMCTFDPRNVERGIPAVVPFLLFKRQAEFVEWVIERWTSREDGVVEKSRDMGVSWLCVAVATWMMLFRPQVVVGFGSRKEEYVDKIGDPKSLFWKIREAINLLPAEFRPDGYDPRIHAPHMRILNPENDAAVVGEAGDNIGRGNRTSIYFKDESAFYEHPEAIDAALSQTSNCKIDVSTPNGAGNPFYRKAHGGKIKKFVFDWRDDPRKDEAWYQRQKENLDEVIVAQEIDRDYTASVANSWIPGVNVTAASMLGPADVMAMGPMQVGVDCARFGGDKTCITFRQGRVCLRQVVAAKLDVVDVAGLVKREVMASPEPVMQIAVDTIGIGSGVADILRRDFGDIVVDVNSSLRMDNGEDYNLRARMWREMKTWLGRGASIPRDPDLQTDLTSLQYTYKGGLLLIESKDDAKKRGIKSPDRADSLALTFAFPVAQQKAAPPSVFPGWAVIDELTGY